MNYFIIFLLVSVMYFSLNEAANPVYTLKGCQPNVVIMSNELSPPGILNIHCFERKTDLGVRNLTSGGPPWVIEFKENDGNGRKVYKCLMRHGPQFKNYYDIQVYRGAYNQRCGETREWAARTNGIYFMKNKIPPKARALPWRQGK